MQKSGLFIDLDGTLADSLRVMRRTYAAFLRQFAVTATDAEFDSLNGPPLRTVVATLKSTHGLPGSEGELLVLYNALLVREYERVEAYEGAEELLSGVRRAGWSTCVVTSSNETLTHGWLMRVGLRHHIDEIVGSERSGRGKPHPDPYLFALQALGCSASASFALEDSRQGAMAAVAAGLRTLVIRTPVEGANWPAVEAHCRNLTEVRGYLASSHG